MSLERVCRKEVVTVSPHTNLLEVARLLRSQHVGSVVVVEERRPVGILTDRDIIVKAAAEEKDPKTLRAGECPQGSKGVI